MIGTDGVFEDVAVDDPVALRSLPGDVFRTGLQLQLLQGGAIEKTGAEGSCHDDVGHAFSERQVQGLWAGDMLFSLAQALHVECRIRFDDQALLRSGLPVVASLAAGPLKLIDQAKGEAEFVRGLEGFADNLPPGFGEVGRLQAVAIVRIRAVHAVLDHPLHLPPEFLRVERPVPKPERTNAVLATGIEKLAVEPALPRWCRG